ncbi:MAG: leucine-rich repeat domain-containing protein [Promethearchaeota archaeon]
MRLPIQEDLSTIKEFDIYKWNSGCGRCDSSVMVASYYFYHLHFQSIGDVPKLDSILAEKYPCIEEKYDKTQGRDIIHIICPNCGLIMNTNTIGREIRRRLIPKGLDKIRDDTIPNTLTVKDLKLHFYEQLGIESKQSDALREIEKIVGFTLIPTQRLFMFFPGIIVENEKLIGLGLSDCLHSFPEIICILTDLKQLNLTNNQFERIPECFKNLKHLEDLDLSRTYLDPFPEIITHLKSLKILRIFVSSFSKIPESIGNLTSLEELVLRNTSKITLPETIGNLTSLKKLTIHGSRINKIPDSIGNLSSLEILNLNIKNRDSLIIPDSVKHLVNKKPKKLLRLKEIYSNTVTVKFLKANINSTLCKEDLGKRQRNEIQKWEWEDTKWERLYEDVVFPYDEIYVVPSVEFHSKVSSQGTFSNWLHIKRKGGIRVMDLKEAYYNHLPNYGDFHFFEFFDYMYDYQEIPVYLLFIGS